jgi:uncharacterized protein (DUF1330 family)
MGKGYILFTEAIRDQAGMDAYSAPAVTSMMQAGGQPIVVADGPEVLEGEWHGSRTVLLEFESVEAAKAWYTSSEYQAAIPLRQAAADCNVVLLPGFSMGG